MWEGNGEIGGIFRLWVFVENVVAKFKVFKFLANKCCNRRKRYKLWAFLICGIIDFSSYYFCILKLNICITKSSNQMYKNTKIMQLRR